jgi:hypothetical protein
MIKAQQLMNKKTAGAPPLAGAIAPATFGNLSIRKRIGWPALIYKKAGQKNGHQEDFRPIKDATTIKTIETTPKSALILNPVNR